jgi:hypothetical protein
VHGWLNMRNKHALCVLVLAFTTLISLTLVSEAKSESNASIFINADGSVSGTDTIVHEGNVYRLTANLTTPIVVECNDIVLDGDGFTLEGPAAWEAPPGINLTCTNVTVQNFNLRHWEDGALCAWNGNTVFNNSIMYTGRGVAIYANNCNVTSNYFAINTYTIRLTGNNTIIAQNSIDDYGLAFSTFTSDTTTGNIVTENNITFGNPALFDDDQGFIAYHNNILKATIKLDIWAQPRNGTDNLAVFDAGYPYGGNYWSDYAGRYPNASEIGNSGIGNTPYVLITDPYVADMYPLMEPFNISQPITIVPFPVTSPSPTSTPNPTPATTQTPNPTLSPSAQASPSPTVPEISAPAILTLTIAGLAVAVAFKTKNPSKAHMQ